MIEILDQLISIHTVIWLLPIAFMFHDLEEIVTVEAWMQRNRADLHKRLPARIVKAVERDLSMETASFAVAVSFMLLGVSLSTVWAGISLDHGGSMLPFAGALAVFFVHSFTHMGQAIALRRYTPGVVTSIVIVLPYSVYTYYRLVADELLTWKMAALGFPVGLICAAPLLLLGHKVGKRINNSCSFSPKARKDSIRNTP
jgi:hypothetical protein